MKRLDTLKTQKQAFIEQFPSESDFDENGKEFAIHGDPRFRLLRAAVPKKG